MSSSTRHGPDEGPALIRISPTRIHTQVTQTVRYRPVRSLLLLGLLVVVSLFVLFTLSQMAVVQHTMMAQLETGRAGGTGVGVSTMAGGGGGRAGKASHRPWRSQFSQFKIEPLLIRNAPSVEVNTALAANRRRANQLAAIIVRNSLLVTHSAHYNHSTHITAHSSADHAPPPASSSSSSSTRTTHPHTTTHTAHVPHPTHHTYHSTHKPTHPTSNSTHSKPPSQSASTPRLRVVIPPAGGRAASPTTVNTKRREMGVERGRVSGRSGEPSAGDRVTHTASTGKTLHAADRDRGKDVRNTDRREKANLTKLRDGNESVRRRFLSKVRCDSGNSDCDNNSLRAPENTRWSPARLQAPVHSSSSDTHQHAGTASEAPSGTTHRPPHTDTDSDEDNTKMSEVLATEFSEAEKDFEPLYLREDDYDLIDSEMTTSASPVAHHVRTTAKAKTRVAHLTEEQLRKLPLCPEIPPGLLGHLDIDLDRLEKLKLEDVLAQLEWVSPGGRWSPVQEPDAPCVPRHKVAVVLPYRDRLHHLIILLSWLHPILRRQQLEYTIYVAEQAGNATFNKGSIMNAGFMEAWQRSDANCFIFHDVDLLPEDDRNMYSCPPQPRHLSVGVDTLGYKLPYFLLVGGVLSVRGDHFLRLNGYSNMYWGWGGEDDDMGYRIKQSGLSITRPPNMLARYTMIRHLKRRPLTWKVRGKLVRTSGRRYRLDGLNTLRYSLLTLHRHPLFTHLLLDVGTPPENLVRLDAH